MELTFTIDTSGVHEALSQLEDVFANEVVLGLKATVAVGVQHAKATTAYNDRRGYLRDVGTRYRIYQDRFRIDLVADTSYAAFVEYGHGPSEAGPINKWLRLDWGKGGPGEIEFRKRTGPAQPHPFIGPAGEHAVQTIPFNIYGRVSATIRSAGL